jgi:hypothetical protein
MRVLRRRLSIIASVVSLFVLAPRAQGQSASLKDVLLRAGAYVDAFHQRFTEVIAEETYVQDSRDRAYDTVQHRELKSDLALIRGADGHFVEFRDVFEVDGRAVRDRQDRLTRLFFDPSPSTYQQLRAIVLESARYNVGRIERTFNTPTFPLIFLEAANQHGSTFALARDTIPELARLSIANGAATFTPVPPGTVVVAYSEGKRNTLIRTKDDKDLPARGRFWIDPATGSVVMSEIVADDSRVRGVIDVGYRQEPTVGGLVPTEMRERYVLGGTSAEGRATYDRFRRFQTAGRMVDVGDDTK